VPDDADAAELLAQWAKGAGDEAISLFHHFASDEHSKLCGAAPKCQVCDVSFCKRLRYR